MLDRLQPRPGARRPHKRVGRGPGSKGHKTAGRGMKGQNSRSGAKIRPGFEGGQLPIIKGLPMKRGFHNPFKIYYQLVKLSALENFEPGERITPEILVEQGLIKHADQPVKVLGDGELSKALTVAAHRFTGSARQKIEAANGAVVEL